MKLLLSIALLYAFLPSFAQVEYATEADIQYYPASPDLTDAYKPSQCRLDLYYPKNTKGFATIIWFHGGGITGGKKEIPEALKNRGYAVAGVGYRLSPKVTAPAYIEDAAAAVAWVFQQIKKYGGSEQLIFVSGHSAGAYLGMMITLDKKYLQKYNIDANDIAGIIPFSGQAVTHFTIRQEKGIGNLQPTIDAYAPLFHVRKDAPPMLLITGDREMEIFGRYEENAYLHRMMKLAGNTGTRLYELQGFDHGGMALPAFPLLLKEVAGIIKERTRNKPQ
ncbi:MAG: alpha/beta hydrolase [Chitinophagaceae bacterium]|nr:alpha/beta hydrolase [Chitinophagaceae bacterium]MCW5926471.1 alpha/beta hydrolase [Chitinophagaceae bacterium]